MKQEQFKTILAGGFATRLPQAPDNAGIAQNLTIDKETGGWSTRVGYEPYKVGATDWTPFGSCGAVYSLHAAQELASGARQSLLFEEGGNLHLLYDASGTILLRTLATGRHIPTPTEAGSWYTDTGYGTVITNGVDRPVIVRPWPLGNAADSANSIARCIRPFCFDAAPPPVDPHKVNPMPAAPPASPAGGGGGAVTLWCPSDTSAIADGGRWGLGFPDNVSGADGDKVALFGWSVAYISDTGSEGPASTLASTTWALFAGSEGWRHAVALDIPVGPTGTVARKLYRTTNYSDDYVSPGDTTLYFIDIIRNNTENIFFDAVQTTNLGQPAPLIPTGPLPAPRARFSAVYGGCLFLDGGLDDPFTLYFSTTGLIEQFAADAFLELPGVGGGVTAIFGNYTSLLVFRENGIDVVQGSHPDFKVTTLSNSITCRAPHSIQAIPGLGVVFLGQDGVYAITGGLEGGAVNNIIGLTGDQDSVIERITPDCHAKSVSAFSAQTREYHLYVPVDGNDRPTLGLVLHVDRLPTVPALSPWTTRVGFPVGALTTRHDGTLVFGHNTGNEAAGSNPQRGLFVISNKRALGLVITEISSGYAAPPTSIYRSAWNSFGDPQVQKQVQYVTLWIMTSGGPTITMRHYKDFSLTAIEERTYVCQPPDATALPELDKALVGKVDYSTERMVPLRFSVATMSSAHFCFEVETTEDIILIGWELEGTTKGIRVVAGVRAS